MSLTIGVRFLTGYCAASQSKTDPCPEWPPHPARLFMALAAGYFECDLGTAERKALDWLETLDAPMMQFSDRASPIEATATFVPMNDSRAIGHGGQIQTVPSLKRHRAERLFPRTHLPEDQDCIYLTWPDAEDEQFKLHRAAFERLCGCVGRLGHASSFVQVWIADEPSENLLHYEPVEGTGEYSLRIISNTSGTLDRLATAFSIPPFRAEIKTARNYRRIQPPRASISSTVFDDRLEIFRLEQADSSFRYLALESTLALSQTLRQAILERCPQPVPESISGHAIDGSALANPHLAMLPMPFVGGKYGDGHLLGIAIAMPRQMSREDQEKLNVAFNIIADEDERRGTGLAFKKERYPGLGQWKLIRQGIFDSNLTNLHVDTWTASPSGSRHWASVTPVVFDQHGKSRSKAAYLDECAELIREATQRVVLGATVEQVRVSAVSPIFGVPTARNFPRLKRKDGSERRHMHVEIIFDREIVGPLLIGAGRYRGYGLCRPLGGGRI